MSKNLFRVNLTNPRNDDEKIVREKTESFSETDKALTPYFSIHVLETPFDLHKESSWYGRDLITEWDGVLFTKPALFGNPLFKEMMKRLGYKGEIVPHHALSEGGRFILGRDFALISDVYEPFRTELEKTMKITGLNLPLHFVPSVIDTVKYVNGAGHIDCDYQIVDNLKILYLNENMIGISSELDREAIKIAEEIAREYGYDLREYKSFDEKGPKPVIEEKDVNYFDSASSLITIPPNNYEHSGFFRKMTGINSILNSSMIFTGSVFPEEESYLRERGMGCVVVPLGNASPMAGLRCIYGEFSL